MKDSWILPNDLSTIGGGGLPEELELPEELDPRWKKKKFCTSKKNWKSSLKWSPEWPDVEKGTSFGDFWTSIGNFEIPFLTILGIFKISLFTFMKNPGHSESRITGWI